jgi:hypothetical protein
MNIIISFPFDNKIKGTVSSDLSYLIQTHLEKILIQLVKSFDYVIEFTVIFDL